MVKVRIPAQLRNLTKRQSEIFVQTTDIRSCLLETEKQFPGLLERICDSEFQVRLFINIYVNGESIQFLNGMETKLRDGDEVSIVPAIAGG